MRVDRKIRRGQSNEAFFLFDVGKGANTREILDLIGSYSERSSSSDWAIGIVLDQRSKVTKLLVLDRKPVDKKEDQVKITRIVPPALQSENPADSFLNRAAGLDDHLRLVREFVRPRSSKKAARPSVTTRSDPSSGLMPARERLASLRLATNGVFNVPMVHRHGRGWTYQYRTPVDRSMQSYPSGNLRRGSTPCYHRDTTPHSLRGSSPRPHQAARNGRLRSPLSRGPDRAHM